MVPAEPVMVTDCAILLLVAWLDWHATMVLVTHEVVLHDARRCTVGELLCLAKFRPYTVTLVPPDSAPFLPVCESPPDRANDTTGAVRIERSIPMSEAAGSGGLREKHVQVASWNASLPLQTVISCIQYA